MFSSILKSVADFLHGTEQEQTAFQRGLLLVFFLFCIIACPHRDLFKIN